jgi:hypothetical protein
VGKKVLTTTKPPDIFLISTKGNDTMSDNTPITVQFSVALQDLITKFESLGVTSTDIIDILENELDDYRFETTGSVY